MLFKWSRRLNEYTKTSLVRIYEVIVVPLCVLWIAKYVELKRNILEMLFPLTFFHVPCAINLKFSLELCWMEILAPHSHLLPNYFFVTAHSIYCNVLAVHLRDLHLPTPSEWWVDLQFVKLESNFFQLNSLPDISM